MLAATRLTNRSLQNKDRSNETIGSKNCLKSRSDGVCFYNQPGGAAHFDG
jgi:hypothetical protein